MAELSPLESYTIYKKREKIPQKYVNLYIIVGGRWYQFCLNLE